MMRFVVPAIAVSLGLHAGLLALTGVRGAVPEGAESRVSSTVIVLDALPAPAASASAGARDIAQQQPQEAEQAAVEDLPEDQTVEPQEVEPVENTEASNTEEVAPESEVAVETPVQEPQQVVEPHQLV